MTNPTNNTLVPIAYADIRPGMTLIVSGGDKYLFLVQERVGVVRTFQPDTGRVTVTGVEDAITLNPRMNYYYLKGGG